jgi:hypothetical protein
MLRITFAIGAGRSEQSNMSHGRAVSVISFVDGATVVGVWPSGRAVPAGDRGTAAVFSLVDGVTTAAASPGGRAASTGAAGAAAGSSAAGGATIATLSLTGASIADERPAEFAGWPGGASSSVIPAAPATRAALRLASSPRRRVTDGHN